MVKLVHADLRDEIAVYSLLEGCEAVAHLGNHANLLAGPSPQRLIAENTAMNANVFRAAVDTGIRRIVFASSVQAILKVPNGMRAEAPYTIPYLPLDGGVPSNPGSELLRALSKEFGERMMQGAESGPAGVGRDVAALPGARSAKIGSTGFTGGGKPVERSSFNFGELLGYLMLSDAAELVRVTLEKQLPGYHQYYPAQTLEVRGVSVAELIREFYPTVPLRRLIDQIEALVDLSAITDSAGLGAKTPRDRGIHQPSADAS